MSHSPLLVFALREENPDVFTHEEVLYTGLGKVQASIALTEHLAENQVSCVVNLGTAGSSHFTAGEVVYCRRFIQRDMDVTPLGFERWQVPFSDLPVVLEHGIACPELPEAICGTGDSFDVSHTQEEYTIVDMEAYALALVCMRRDIPFVCLKYISDGADSEAASDWNEALLLAANGLQRALSTVTLPGRSG
jgi:adenosylhomocysteine nucleosidase